MNVYPNPCFGDTFTIVIPNTKGKALASFTDENGRLTAIKYLQFDGDRAVCTTDGLHKGLYVITLRSKNTTYKQKVVIE